MCSARTKTPLTHTDDAPVRAVSCSFDIQRLCFMMHATQELLGLMTLEFKRREASAKLAQTDTGSNRKLETWQAAGIAES